jgi:hypothetical protein
MYLTTAPLFACFQPHLEVSSTAGHGVGVQNFHEPGVRAKKSTIFMSIVQMPSSYASTALDASTPNYYICQFANTRAKLPLW